MFMTPRSLVVAALCLVPQAAVAIETAFGAPLVSHLAGLARRQASMCCFIREILCLLMFIHTLREMCLEYEPGSCT